MKNGAKIGMIILLAVMIVLSAAGIAGLTFVGRERAAQKEPYEQYLDNVRQYEAEARCYAVTGEQAVANMDAYIAQMEKNQAAFEKAGGRGGYQYEDHRG